jgi:hypothetical protein
MKTRFTVTNQPPKQDNSMGGPKCSILGLVSGAALLGALTGCVGYVDSPPQGRVYPAPQPVYVESPVVVQPEYVYYPNYEVYYVSNTRQYYYRDGRSWVSRGAPPHVSSQVLFASPSVRLDFHDSPSIHHASVARQYPRNWAPQGGGYGDNQGHDEGHGEGHR